MSATTIKRVEWTIGYDEPDQTWYIGMVKNGAPIRLNGHYLTKESAELDLKFLSREYEAVTSKARKEGALFN